MPSPGEKISLWYHTIIHAGSQIIMCIDLCPHINACMLHFAVVSSHLCQLEGPACQFDPLQLFSHLHRQLTLSTDHHQILRRKGMLRRHYMFLPLLYMLTMIYILHTHTHAVVSSPLYLSENLACQSESNPLNSLLQATNNLIHQLRNGKIVHPGWNYPLNDPLLILAVMLLLRDPTFHYQLASQ